MYCKTVVDMIIDISAQEGKRGEQWLQWRIFHFAFTLNTFMCQQLPIYNFPFLKRKYVRETVTFPQPPFSFLTKVQFSSCLAGWQTSIKSKTKDAKIETKYNDNEREREKGKKGQKDGLDSPHTLGTPILWGRGDKTSHSCWQSHNDATLAIWVCAHTSSATAASTPDCTRTFTLAQG